MFPFHLSEQQADNAGWDFELYLQDALGLLVNSKHIYIYVGFFAVATFLKCRVATSGKSAICSIDVRILLSNIYKWLRQGDLFLWKP